MFLVGQAVTAAAIWGAIRSDIRHLTTAVTEAKESSRRAHARIDDLLKASGRFHE